MPLYHREDSVYLFNNDSDSYFPELDRLRIIGKELSAYVTVIMMAFSLNWTASVS